MNQLKLDAHKISAITQVRNLTQAEHEAFRLYLREEYGTSELPEAVDNALFGKAWGDGHSCGYHEVELHYGELADLVLLAYRTN